MNVDLHLHTTESDGRLTPEALMQSVAQVGLDRFSITDHDTLAVYERHPELLAPFRSRLITGVEVSTNTGEREVHILGYGVRREAVALQGILCDRTAVRSGRAEHMVELLNQAGVMISMDDVRRHARRGMIGRPHVARALVEIGAARDIADAFDRFIGVGCVAYLPSSTIKPAEAIVAINQSGVGAPDA